MNPNFRELFARFGYHLGHVTGFVCIAIENDEVLAEFAARGITIKELKDFLSAAKDVAQVFYNDARPA